MKKELSILMKELAKLIVLLVLSLIILVALTHTLYIKYGYYNAVRNMIVIVWKVVLIAIVVVILFLVAMHRIIKESIEKDGTK